jgi:hypothetical protein
MSRGKERGEKFLWKLFLSLPSGLWGMQIFPSSQCFKNAQEKMFTQIFPNFSV